MRVRRLVWDEWNIEHISRHEVSPEEVEEACHCNPLVLGGKKGRLVVVGPTDEERMLAVILAQYEEAGVFYVVTARPASKKETKYYEQMLGGESL